MKQTTISSVLFSALAVSLLCPAVLAQEVKPPASAGQVTAPASDGKATAPAAQPETPEQKAARLAVASRGISIELEQKISNLVARHIPAQEFQVSVSVQVGDDFQDPLSYFPGSVAPTTAATDVAPTLKSVEVTIFLGQRFGKETTTSLEKILRNKLVEVGQNELKINFENMSVKTEPADSEIQRRLQKAEADLRAVSSNAQTVERERNDIKSELTNSKTNFENLIKEQQEKAKAAEKKAKSIEESKETLKNLMQTGVWVVIAIVLGVFLILASKLFAGAIKSVGAGISTIAGSLETLASSLGQKNESYENEETEESAPQGSPSVGGSGGSTSSLETLRARVVEINAELAATINENNENIVLKYLSNLLSHPDTVDTAVATMEILGKDKANQMFYRLGRDFQEQIVNFLNHGHYKKNKIELMVDAGEQLITRLMGENFKAARGVLTPEMTEVLLQTSISDIAEVVMTLEMDHRLRLFFYLESGKLADVLSMISKSMPSELEDIGNHLHRISEFERAVEIDQILVKALRQRLDANQQDHMEPYMKYYQEVLETMEESIVEGLMEKLSGGDERLRKHLQANIVTFNTYFRLPEDMQKSMLDGLGNKAIATLMVGTEEQQGKLILSHVEERRHSMIQEEIDSMQNQSKKEIRVNFDKVKTTLISRMRVLAKSGALAELMENSVNKQSEAA